MQKLNLENKQKDYPLKNQHYLHNIYMASCNFALEELLFYHRSSPGVLHLRCDNGNLWQMELFWKAFPGCLFPDETHLFLLLSFLRRLRGENGLFTASPRRVRKTKSALWKFNYHKWWAGAAGACTGRAALFSHRGRFPRSQHTVIALNHLSTFRLKFLCIIETSRFTVHRQLCCSEVVLQELLS